MNRIKGRALAAVFAVIIVLAAVIVIVIRVGSKNSFDPKDEEKYLSAVALHEEGKYAEARLLFMQLGYYKDSREYVGSYTVAPQLITEQDGRVTRLEYDENGNILKELVTKDGEDISLKAYTYGEDGNIQKKTFADKNGNSQGTVYSYNIKGQLIQTVTVMMNGKRTVNEYEYNKNGLETKRVFTDENGKREIFRTSYDKYGNKKRETWDLTGGRTAINYKYNGKGCNTEWTMTVGGDNKMTCTLYYDGNCNLIKEYTDAISQSVEYTYDEKGFMIKKVTSIDNEITSTAEYSDHLIFFKGK